VLHRTCYQFGSYVRSGQVRSDQFRSGQVSWVRSGQVRSGQRSVQVRLGQVRSGSSSVVWALQFGQIENRILVVHEDVVSIVGKFRVSVADEAVVTSHRQREQMNHGDGIDGSEIVGDSVTQLQL
jgi:hypothetical protein